jgi:hypothetical protein
MAIERSVFNVDQFKAQMKGGGARANQFFVLLKFPGYVATGPLATVEASFLVNAAALPGSIVNPTIVPYRGREVKFAGERTFQPWTISVLNDVSFNIRNSLENWMSGMNGLENNTGKINPVEYTAQLYVTQLDRNNLPLKSYTLVGAFPTDISDIALSYGDNDTIETYTVTFQYQHYITNFDQALSLGNAAKSVISSLQV